MAHAVRRYVIKIREDSVEIDTQAQSPRGTYFRTGGLVVPVAGKNRADRELALATAIEALTPKKPQSPQ